MVKHADYYVMCKSLVGQNTSEEIPGTNTNAFSFGGLKLASQVLNMPLL